MFSNINATKDQPRVNPERAAAVGSGTAWPTPCYLPVGRGHQMAWRTVGNPAGAPWLLLHGGPGSSCQPGMLAPLDLTCQWAIAPDQRGCGASSPQGKTSANTTQALVADLEALRVHLGVLCWSVLAGSWGTVVALAYAQAHPQRVQRLVLRGAFALRRREVGGLLRPGPGVLRTLGPEPHWPCPASHAVTPVLVRLKQLLQSGTPGVASLRVSRRWNLLETEAAGRGMWRSLLQARSAHRPTLAASIQRQWAGLRRQQRRAQAQVHRTAAHPADHRAANKFRIQSHYLLHRGFMRSGGLDQAVLSLAAQGIPVDWVHGRFDAICPPANSRRWAAMGHGVAGGLTSLASPCSGHLGHEADMLATLRARVRSAH